MARPIGSKNSNREFMLYDEFRAMPVDEQAAVIKFLGYLHQDAKRDKEAEAADAKAPPPSSPTIVANNLANGNSARGGYAFPLTTEGAPASVGRLPE